jgi:hypothetical protein
MRRMILSFSREDLAKVQGDKLSHNIESFVVLLILRQDGNEITLIAKVKLKDPTLSPDFFHEPDDHVQLLERNKNDGVYTYFVQTKLVHGSRGRVLFGGILKRGYVVQPFEVENGQVKMTFLAASTEIRRLLQRIEKKGLRYKVLSLDDARFSQNSPISRLTNKQRRVLITAYNMGYYDLPKKISSRALAEKLGMQHSTLSIHRIKAERKLIETVLTE